jgi:Zn-dependent M28 family amino/carboxypeptidase
MHPNPHLSIDRQIAGDVYTSDEIWENLATLCDEFGSRFGGTPGEKQAADFMKARLEAYGLKAWLEEVPYTGWRRGRTTLEILSPVQQQIPCISLPHSPPASLEGVLLDMGQGVPEDFERRAEELKGKIVLTTSEAYPKGSSRWVHRNEKYGRALLAGATGFIFVNHYPGYGPATGGIGEEGYTAAMPGISVAWEDGTYLQRLVKRHGEVRIRICSDDVIEPMVSWNVLADLPGKSQPETFVMLGSHYDGHDISQGAADPASGTVAVLEAARVLAQYAPDLPCTVRFALWGIEEIGLLGSTRYVQEHTAELDNIRFYLNMDMAGAMDSKDIEINMWDELGPIFEAWSAEMALPFQVEQSLHAHSDHYPLLMAGVPTGGIANLSSQRTGRGYGHTRYDTLDKVELRSLREAAVLAARLALRIASREDWPASRRPAAEVEKVLDNPDNREETEIFKRIHAFYKERVIG